MSTCLYLLIFGVYRRFKVIGYFTIKWCSIVAIWTNCLYINALMVHCVCWWISPAYQNMVHMLLKAFKRLYKRCNSLLGIKLLNTLKTSLWAFKRLILALGFTWSKIGQKKEAVRLLSLECCVSCLIVFLAWCCQCIYKCSRLLVCFNCLFIVYHFTYKVA